MSHTRHGKIRQDNARHDSQDKGKAKAKQSKTQQARENVRVGFVECWSPHVGRHMVLKVCGGAMRQRQK